MTSIKPRGVWWLTPLGALSLIALPTLALAAVTPESHYRFDWGTPKALTSHTVLLALAGALTFIVAGSLPFLGRTPQMGSAWPAMTASQNQILTKSVPWLFWLTIAGYLTFAVSGFRNGLRLGNLTGALTGQNDGLKTTLGHVTGVTSLTQVGVAFVVVAGLLLVQRADRRLAWKLGIILVLGLLRAALLAERLAFLELIIPFATVIAMRTVSAGRSRAKAAVHLAPLILIPLVLIAFGAFEYSRSWTYYSTRTTISYPSFVIERFAGYYATAYNNGQLELNYETYQGRIPYDTIEALWTAPGASLFGGYPSGNGTAPPTAYSEILQLHGNPEFNSPGGLLIPFVDWGTQGGLVVLALIGGLVGTLYRRCVNAHPFAVVLFPSMTTGLFELPRYIYWTLGRYTPALVALCIVGFLLQRDSGRSGALAVDAGDELQVTTA
jgi:oligosaccharide repeat unit polymerase